ncbi:MAG TPA: carbohydrate-binding domain-containing protein [Thermoguttaceae bacterium]|nr:carbohydrate-binding domain-containing protein [Thermoguttaceae bacterium]
MCRFRAAIVVLIVFSPLVGMTSGASLDGTWEACFQETDSTPGPEAEWKSIRVPSLVGRVEGKPFLWYRRSFEAPAKAARERLFLRIGASRFVTTVLVNGTEVGSHYGGWEPFEVDVTGACKSDGPNLLVVRVQDVTGVIDEGMPGAPPPRGARYIDQASDSVMAPVGSRYSYVGIWQPVTVFARSDVFLDDVFVKTSVRQSTLEVDYTLENLAAEPKTVTLASHVADTDVRLGERTVTVPAKSSSTVTLKTSWEKPRLWGPEDPHLYHLVTLLAEQGGARDERRDRFGFREFWTEKDKLILNGTPINFLATAGHPRGELDAELSKEAAIDFYGRIRQAGCAGMRLHANVWPKGWYEAADEVGMPLIMESALFCYARAYGLSKDEFWDNYHDHLRAILKDHRNHPAIVMISLENEILHCGGNRVPQTEHRLAEAGRLVKRLDPTRPILYDGDGDPEGAADVVNLHYPLDFNERNLWPGAGYWLETGLEVSGWPREFFKWDRTKPLYFGEFLHIQHYREPDPFSALIGDAAYLGYDRAMAQTKALAWEMQIEAYRACGVSGTCPWTLTETGDFPSDDNPRYLAVKRAYEKNAALVREYDARFFSGEKVARTVYLYNDTLHPASLALEWKLLGDGSAVDSGRERFDLPPAGRREVKITPTMPEVDKPSPVSLSLTVLRGEERVYQSEKRYWVFPRRPLDVPQGLRIALYEGPDRTVGRALADARVTPLRVEDLTKLPQADVLLIGPHALDAAKPAQGLPVVGGQAGPRQAISAFVRRGGSVVVLEQDTYEHGLLPARLVDRGATIAFQRTALGPFPPLTTDAWETPFRFWRGDHVVARKTISKPSHGRFRALVDSGGPEGLVYVAVLELLEGRGRYLLSQLAIGEKLADEPAAQRTLQCLLRHAASPPEPPSRLAVVQEKLPLAGRLRDLDALFTDVSGRLDRAELVDFGVLLAEADSSEVAENCAKIRRFAEGGGRVILHGGTPKGIARLGDLFPEPIFAQRTGAIPVALAEPDRVIDGLAHQDLYWYGDREGLSGRVQTPLSTAVADYAITAGEPDPARSVVVEAESMEVEFGEPGVDEESVYMSRTASIRKKVAFPQSGRYTFLVRGRGTPCAGEYPRVELSLDGRRSGSVTTEGDVWETYQVTAPVVEGEHTLGLAFVNDAHDPAAGEDRNVRLDRVVYGPTPPLKSKRLLEPAVLVKVPIGRGFVLVDQVRWAEDDSNPEKAGRYVSNLLTNLGCPFGDRSGGVTIAAATMEPQRDFRFSRGDDGAAYLGSNGTIARRVRFAAAGEYELVIQASGSEAAGELPIVRVGLDDEPIGDVRLEKPGWHALRLKATVAEGEHDVSLSFTNDFYDPPADRNLRIRSLVIRPAQDESRDDSSK